MLTDRKIFSRSPILEAIIDFRISPPKEAIFPVLFTAAKELDPSYPKEFEGFNVNEVVQPDGTKRSTSTRLGVMRKSADEKNIVQMRLTGLTYSRLAPYERWESFSSEASKIWDLYKKHVQPTKVERIGVRYLNTFVIPDAPSEVASYFKALPEAPTSIKAVGSEFLLQLRTELLDVPGKLILNVGVTEKTETTFKYLLDIDVYCTELGGKPEWEIVELLHTRVEEVFRSTITPKAESLII